MGKYIRTFIAIIVILSLAILAKSNAAWAANAGAGDNQTSLAQAELSMSLDRDDDCDKDKDKDKCCGKDKDKDKDKCCGKDKDKDKCDDDDGGSVKPPDDDIDDCEHDDLSVGGVATLQIKRLRDRDCLRAHIESSSSLSGTPSGAGTVLSDLLVLEVPARGAKVKICFAVPPGKQVKIYSSQGSWRSLKTTVRNDVACAQISNSGSYMLVGQ